MNTPRNGNAKVYGMWLTVIKLKLRYVLRRGNKYYISGNTIYCLEANTCMLRGLQEQSNGQVKRSLSLLQIHYIKTKLKSMCQGIFSQCKLVLWNSQFFSEYKILEMCLCHQCTSKCLKKISPTQKGK